MEIREIQSIIEAVLFAAGDPVELLKGLRIYVRC